MALLGADNQVGILIKADSDLKGIDDANKSLGHLESQAGHGGKATAALGAAGKLAAVGMVAAGAAIGAAGFAAFKSAGSYEQSRIAFETMLGSADKAQKLMTEIAAFAKSTPFELPEVVAGSKQLLAFGYAQEQIIPTMRKIGDIAAGVGVPVGQLTTIFGQVKVAGRLMGQDLLQFTNAGVPMIEALAKVMKKPQTEIKQLIEQGKVGFPEVEAALESLTGNGSKFGGMMEKQSKSFSGVVSNIKDGFGQILRNAVGITVAGDIVEGGLFDRLKGAAEATLPYIAKLAENVGPAMGKVMDFFKMGHTVITAFVQTLKDPDVTSDGWFGEMEKFASGVRAVWDIVWNFLKPSIVALVNTFKSDLLPALQRLWVIIGPQIIPTLKVLGMIIGGVLIAAIWAAINVIRIIAQVLGWLINVAIEVGQRVAWMVNFIISYLTLLWNFWSTVFNIIYNIAKTIFEAIYLAIAVAVSLIRVVVDPIVHYLSRPFQIARDWVIGAWNGVVGWFRNIAGWIGNAVSGVYNTLTSPFSRAWDWISGLPGRIASKIGDVGALLRKNIGDWDIPGPLGKVRDVIPGFATGVRNFRGGLALVGEKGPELVNLPGGSDVFTNSESAQMASGGSRSTTIHTLNVFPQTAEAVREMFKQLDQDQLLAGSGFAPNRGAF